MKLVPLFFLLVCFAHSLRAQADDIFETKTVASELVAVYVDGRPTAQITKGWPATVAVWFSAEVKPASLQVVLGDTAGHLFKWPWKEGAETATATGVLRYLTLAPADTLALSPGDFTLTIQGLTSGHPVNQSIALAVEGAPSQLNLAEEAENERVYFRVIGDYAQALTAAEKLFKLAPQDPLRVLAYAGALLQADRAQEALDLVQNIINQSEGPPEEFLYVANLARAQLLRKVGIE